MSLRMPADCGGGERQECRMTWFITLSIAFLPYSHPAKCTINYSQQFLPTTNQQFEKASQSASCSDTPRPARTTWLIYRVLSQPLFTSFSFCPHLHEWWEYRLEIAWIRSYNNIQARAKLFDRWNKVDTINTKPQTGSEWEKLKKNKVLIALTMVRPGCMPARIASIWVGVNGMLFLLKHTTWESGRVLGQLLLGLR